MTSIYLMYLPLLHKWHPQDPHPQHRLEDELPVHAIALHQIVMAGPDHIRVLEGESVTTVTQQLSLISML